MTTFSSSLTGGDRVELIGSEGPEYGEIADVHENEGTVQVWWDHDDPEIAKLEGRIPGNSMTHSLNEVRKA